ncbi:gamma-glutamyltransferase [Thalassobaculum sp.]|uniref:gamma-glutamyltransferase family protein n=1 Tax=Thalassobaculum sp. TaxID=2022740 RepID=UPI0032EC99FA
MMEPWKTEVAGTRHMAVAGHYLAAHAAFMVLEAGGNAIDAGVAGGLALGVVQSDLVNIAGVAPIMIRPASGTTITIDGLGGWPRGLDPDLFTREHGGAIPHGLLRTVVPAAPAAWIQALRQFGTMSFGEVAHSAIRLAREGFPLHRLTASVIAEHEAEYRRWPSNTAIYMPGGKLPQAGDIFRQEDLGRSLQYMADQEAAAANRGREAGLNAARDAFYRGDLGRQIVAFHEANGGLLRERDLTDYQVSIDSPVATGFADGELLACGVWCQGPTLIQVINLLKGFDLGGLTHNGPEHLHLVIESIKLAFADREHLFGDPRFVDVPVDRLISTAYADERRAMLRRDRAYPDLPPPGLQRAVAREPALVGAGDPPPPPDTSYVCTVDRWGNAFSATPSDVSYQSQVIPGTGFVPSSRGSASWGDPRHPSGVAPGKRPRLTPNPAMWISPDGRAMPFGTPGGDVQIQAMTQFLLNLLVFKQHPQVAVEQPRVATYSQPDTFEPHPAYPGMVKAESRIAEESVAGLQALGHQMSPWPERTHLAGSICAIVPGPGGSMIAASDHRRPTYALGW